MLVLLLFWAGKPALWKASFWVPFVILEYAKIAYFIFSKYAKVAHFKKMKCATFACFIIFMI